MVAQRQLRSSEVVAGIHKSPTCVSIESFICTCLVQYKFNYTNGTALYYYIKSVKLSIHIHVVRRIQTYNLARLRAYERSNR